jgi:uncharacterized membrane protein YecN with MAPEG domain
MISVFYAVLFAILIIWLSLNVIKLRHSKQISIGDAGDIDLKTAVAAQTNSLEYIPIALLLMYPLEYNGASLVIIHFAGILMLVGRLIHARAMLSNNIKFRILGMQITIWVIIGLATANLLFLPYTKFLNLW